MSLEVVLSTSLLFVAICYGVVYMLDRYTHGKGQAGQKENEELNATVNFLMGELQKKAVENDELRRREAERQLKESRHGEQRKVETPPSYGPDLVLICGEPEFCNDDESQLIRAKVWYRKIEVATKRLIEDEFQRRRENRDFYKWAIVSAHGNPQGVVLADGMADRRWWNRTASGFQVIMLANCEGQSTGDLLAGLVDFVVCLYGERDSIQVSNYVYSFWSEMVASGDARRAYQQAGRDVPQLRAYSDLRVR